MSAQGKTPTVDTVMEAWQRDAKPPTWAQIVAMKQEHAELRETAARQASLLRGCYAADHKQKQRIEELTSELERIKALPPVAWRSSMGHGVTLKETITDDQKTLTWDGKPMWQPLIALGSKT